MRHAIDPKIDCVFKALLGSVQNRNLLIHFLNAFLANDLGEAIVSVEILNPYNEKEFLNDKLSIVDVKAKDAHGKLYQIEIQLNNSRHLPARIIYNWADIYSQQLTSGQSYAELKPTYAIWLLANNLILDDNHYRHYFKFRDEHGRVFADHGSICLLELVKYDGSRISSEEQRWLKFFKDGEQLNDEALPDWMRTLEMKQAMSTLSLFSEKEREYFAYQSRQEYRRLQQALQLERETAEREKETAEREKEIALRQKEAAERDKELAERKKEIAEREKAAIEINMQAMLLENQAALSEIERLKLLLAEQQNKD